MTNIEPKTLKGFKDYSPDEAKLRQNIAETCRKVFELYGFQPLDTPALEYAEILEQKYGEDEKLIYKFEDRGGREIGLRYDLTVPLARYVAENLNDIKLPFRRYQIGNAWRAENPQKGRFREFMQADADVVGVSDLSADAECIALYFEIFKRLGIEEYKIYFSTRDIYDALSEKLGIEEGPMRAIIRTIDKLDKIELDEAINILSDINLTPQKLEGVKEFIEIFKAEDQLATAGEYFKDSFRGKQALQNLRQIESYLKALGVKNYKIDLSIARGLDYYTGTVFECRLNNSDVGSVGGGGRYDSLVAQFLGKSLSAVGMSVGVDRLLSYLLEKENEKTSSARVLVMNLGNDYTEKALQILNQIREVGVPAQYYYDEKDLDKQFKYAESLGINFAVIVGQKESESGKAQVKDLKQRTQEEVSFSEIVDYLKKKV